MRTHLRRGWSALGLGADVQGRLGFAVFVGTSIIGGFAYIRERTDAVTAVIYIGLVLLAFAGVVLMVHSGRADERSKWEGLVADAERRAEDAEKAAAGRVEDERRRTEDRMRAEADARVKAVHEELEAKVAMASAFGVLVPLEWNAIIVGFRNPDAPVAEIVPPGYLVQMGPGDQIGADGSRATGIGSRVYNAPGGRAEGIQATVGHRPYKLVTTAEVL